MAGLTVFTHAFLIDCTGAEPVDGAAVVVEGERSKDVIRGAASGLSGAGSRRSTSRARP